MNKPKPKSMPSVTVTVRHRQVDAEQAVQWRLLWDKLLTQAPQGIRGNEEANHGDSA